MKNSFLLIMSLLCVTASAILSTGCGGTPAKPTVRLERESVPANVLNIAGEALFFQSRGESGKMEKISVSLKDLQYRVGGFEKVLVYEFNKDGKKLSRQEMKLDSEKNISISATEGNYYLTFAQLGSYVSGSYSAACHAHRASPSEAVAARVCDRIFCTAGRFRGSYLSESEPELRNTNFGNEMIGGLGGDFGGDGGSICETCTAPRGLDDFMPVDGCDSQVSPSLPEHSDDDIVYEHQTFEDLFFDLMIGPSQIFKKGGGSTINLSNTQTDEWSPDVNHSSRQIVLVSSRNPGPPALGVMDIDGGNFVSIPNTIGAASPKWKKGVSSAVIFQSPSLGHSAISSISLDGSNLTQITFPADDERDQMPDTVNAEYLVFSRRKDGSDAHNDIYLQHIGDKRPPTRLTDTDNLDEMFPVISHNGQMIAYGVHFPDADEIRYGYLDTQSGTITNMRTIRLPSTIGNNFAGIDFSTDDSYLFFAAGSSDVGLFLLNRRMEIFSLKLSGSDRWRLTNNSDSDTFPNSVPKEIDAPFRNINR